MPISVVARTGLGADKNEPAYEFGVAERKGLRDVSADRETEDIDVCKSQSMDECGCVVSLRPDRIRGLAAGAGNASIVQQNDRTIRGQSISECWIPVVHAAAPGNAAGITVACR